MATQMAKRAMAFAFATLALASGSSAQQATFKSSVSLLQVEVTVLDKDGRPVPGLRAGDFTVEVNGKVRPVRNASFIQASSDAATETLDARAAVVTRNATNAPPTSDPRLFVILVDDLSISATNHKGLFVSGERFLSRVPANDYVGVATSSGLGQMINPTRDRPAVEKTLRKTFGSQFDPRTLLSDKPFVGMVEAIEIDEGLTGVLLGVIQRECHLPNATAQRLDLLIVNNPCAEETQRRARRTATLAKKQATEQIGSYIAVINAMATAPGIKHLVVLTGGLPVHGNVIDLFPVARAAAAAGIQMTVLGEEPDIDDASYKDDRRLLQNSQTMAEMSGGQFFWVIGQAERFFDRVLMTASAVYRLGVELPADVIPGASVTVNAEVARKGLTVLAAHHAAAPTTEVALPIDEQLKAAIATGRPQYAVPIRIGTASHRSPADPALTEVIVNVAVPASVSAPLTTMFGLVDEAGKVTSGRRVVTAPSDADEYRLSFAMPPMSGANKLRFAVADANGAVGSVEIPAHAALATIGPFTSSDLMLWWVDGKNQAQFLTLEDVPSAVTELHASLELYPGMTAAPADLVVRFTITPQGQTTAVAAHDGDIATETKTAGTTRAEAAFSIAALAPGAYTLRAAVIVDGVTAGEALATIRKR
jgi:hypothetical protein